MRSLIATRVPGHPQVALLGFSRAGGVRDVAGQFSGVRGEGGGPARRPGTPGTFPRLARNSDWVGVAGRPIRPTRASSLRTAANPCEPVAAGLGVWGRSHRGPGDLWAARGGTSGGGAGTPGSGLSGAGRFQRLPDSAQPARSSQVRAPRAGGAAPGLRHSGRGRVGTRIRAARGGFHKPRDGPSWNQEGFSLLRAAVSEGAPRQVRTCPLRTTKGQVRVPP